MTEFRIPFNRPWLTGKEHDNIALLSKEGHFSGDGPFTQRCQAYLEEELSVPRVLLTTSGTHALELAALLLDIGPGDEVVMPSFTFVSTANAFVLRGARPVFVDIRSDTLNLDETKLGEALTEKTRAIVPVHYAGIGCEMDTIVKIAQTDGVPIVEDNALGLFGRYRSRYLGTFGELGALSFHETKSFSCGEGGALVINDPALVERAEIIREKGTDRSRFRRGLVDKYTWVETGSSYVPSDILAAFLYAQFEAKAEIIANRRRIWQRYQDLLGLWAVSHGVGMPTIPGDCEPVHCIFHLVMPSTDERDELIDRLKARGILAVFHYVPLHLSEMGTRLGWRPGDLPNTEAIAGCLVRLPFYHELTADLQREVAQAIMD